MPINRTYGFKKSKFDPRDYHLRTVRKSIYKNLPSSVDLRHLVPEVLNQEQTSSCVAHSFVAADRILRLIEKYNDIKLSRMFVYWNLRFLENDIDQDGGGELRDGAKALATYGAPHEADFPFTMDNLFKQPPQVAYKDAINNITKTYLTVGQTEQEFKQCLAEGYPFVFGTDLYEAFESDEVAKTGIVPMANWNNDKLVGGHAITCVGYDDSTRYFTVLNSWGSDWGDHGYCYFPYDYLLNSAHTSDVWTLRATAPVDRSRKWIVPDVNSIKIKMS